MKNLFLACLISLAITLVSFAIDLTVINKWVMVWNNDTTSDNYKEIVQFFYASRQVTVGYSITYYNAKAFDDSITAVNYADSLGLYFDENTQY